MEARLIQRLEAAVERLERMQGGVTASGGAGTAPVTASRAGPTTPSTAAPAPAASPASSLPEFDQIISTHVTPLTALSASLPAEVQKSVSHFVQGMQETRKLMATAAGIKRPDPGSLQQLLDPVAQHMIAATSLTEGRRTASFNWLKVVAEATQGFSWLAYAPGSGMPAPSQHVADSWQSAEFFASKLQMEAKAATAPPGSAEAAAAWVKQIKEAMKQLQVFVGRHAPQGLQWGTGAAAPLAPAPAAPKPGAAGGGGPAKAGGPPPPPPPGPPPKALTAADLKSSQPAAAPAAAGGGGGSMSALFKEIQQGEAITKSLKKVTDDMKTKNRTDRSGLVATPETRSAAVPAAAGRAGQQPAGPPVLEFDAPRKKWRVENQVGQQGLTLDQVAPQHTIYIYGCTDTVIQVTGKANTISIDNCKKTGVVFGDLIGTCEVVNCKDLKLQCTGYVPTVAVEKTDGVELYIPAQATQNPDFQVVTAKCSAINIQVLPADPNGQEDIREFPVPEQFITTFGPGGQAVTKAAVHSGA